LVSYNWGVAQAQAAVAAWLSTQGVCRSTYFADIEGPGTYGWGSNTSLSQSVFEGFCNQLAADPRKFIIGVYTSTSAWSGIMGSGYGLPAGTPLWSADNQLTGSQCNVCPTSLSGLPAIGGVTPVIWQYNITVYCPADLDCAESLPF
jgi:hypothetical protein